MEQKTEIEVHRKRGPATDVYASCCQALVNLAAQLSLAMPNLARCCCGAEVGVLHRGGAGSFQIPVRKAQSPKVASTLLNLMSLLKGTVQKSCWHTIKYDIPPDAGNPDRMQCQADLC